MRVSTFAVGKKGAWRQRFLAAVVAASLTLGFVDCALASLDYGTWNDSSMGVYSNGDKVTVNLGPNTLFGSNEFDTDAVGVPFDQPDVRQYSHFANNFATSSWAVTIDLSQYHVTSQTVFAFANLGAGINSGTQTANIVFRDASSTPLPLENTAFLNYFPHHWDVNTFDDVPTFELSDSTTGLWKYSPDSNNVQGASAIFFLTNLPTNAASIEFTVNNPENSPNYRLDSVFFAVGSPVQVVPEASTILQMLPTVVFLLFLQNKRGRLFILKLAREVRQ
jgi:hypothetical protein